MTNSNPENQRLKNWISVNQLRDKKNKKLTSSFSKKIKLKAGRERMCVILVWRNTPLLPNHHHQFHHLRQHRWCEERGLSVCVIWCKCSNSIRRFKINLYITMWPIRQETPYPTFLIAAQRAALTPYLLCFQPQELGMFDDDGEHHIICRKV